MQRVGCGLLLVLLLVTAVAFPPLLLFVGPLAVGLGLVIFFGARLLEDLSGRTDDDDDDDEGGTR